jgi:hypothetical protein
MGYESYKLTAKFQNVTSSELKRELIDLGARFVEAFGNNFTLEIVRESGIIEIVLSDVKHRNLDFSPADRVLMEVLFSKTSEVRLVYHIMSLIQTIAQRHELAYLRDETSKEELDCHHYAMLTGAVLKAKSEFEAIFPKVTQTGRSRDLLYHCTGVQSYMEPDSAATR